MGLGGEIYRLFQGHIRDPYVYPPEKKGSTNSNGVSSRSLFEGIMPLQAAVTATFSEVL